MRKVILAAVLFFIVSHGFSQVGMIKKDTTLYFYAWLKSENGTYLISDIDTIKIRVQNIGFALFQLNEANKLRFLSASNQRIKNDRVSFKPKNDILEVAPSFFKAKESLNKIIRTNKGSVIHLPSFRFTKPSQSTTKKERVDPIDND